MIYAVKHNKVNRGLYKANEDSLTAAVFERLMYLPKELFQYILEKALFENISDLDLNTLESIEYWPNWNPDYTDNSNHVQPDIFIRTSKSDIIIEAKRYDKGQQIKSQWHNEIQAYYNEYNEDEKKMIFIALGGIHREDTELFEIKGLKCPVYKCTWVRILDVIKEVKYRLEHSFDLTHNNIALNKILSDLVLCFALYGFSTAEWFERFLPPQNIKISGIQFLSSEWKN